MLIKLIILFSIIPIIELAILIQVGTYAGVLFTVLLVALTGVVGVSLAKIQGLLVITKIKRDLNQGKIPADDLIGGLLILIGGVFLLTPGLLTDITGFALILPGSRYFFTKILKNKFKKYIGKHITSHQFGFSSGSEKKETEIDNDNVIDIDFEEEEK